MFAYVFVDVCVYVLNIAVGIWVVVVDVDVIAWCGGLLYGGGVAWGGV